MLEIFGPHTERVLAFLAGLHDLSARDIDTVSEAWREVDTGERAEAWVRVHRVLADGDRQPVLAAAAVARQEAQAVAHRYGSPEWPFWAAAADAGAALAAGDRIGRYYVTLISPLAAVLSWLPPAEGGTDARRSGVAANAAAGVVQPGVVQQGA